jgi:hypothetical protein
MPRKLTNKQEAYKNNRIAGMGVSESYRASYDASGMSDKAVSKEADILEKDPRIAPEVKLKRKEAADKALVTTEDVVRLLYQEAKGDGKDTSPAARVSALKTLGDFTGGFDANTKKVAHSGAIDLSNKTQAELEAIIESG